MRILHTADWHLGRRLNRVQRLDEQRELLADLVRETERLDPDAVVVAGDVFDVFTPGADAERLYYDTVQRLADGGARPVLVVAGNHDSPSKLTAPRGLLETQGVLAYGDPHDPDDVPETRAHDGFAVEDAGPGWVDLTSGGQRALFHLLPFPARSRLPARVDDPDASATQIVETLAEELPSTEEPRYLVGHLFVGGGHDVDEDRDDYVGGAYAVAPSALERYDAAFLGHLHRPFGADAWRYAGSPLAFDFDDPEVDRGGWVFEAGDWTKVTLEGARPLTVRRPESVGEAIEAADGVGEAWTRLVFQSGVVLTRRERERVREAFRDRLVDIRFDQADTGDDVEHEGVDLGDVDPEQAFRSYVEARTDEPPEDELVDLFLEVLEPREADDADGGEETEGSRQATLGVDP